MEEQDQNLAHIHWSWPEAITANPARSLATPDLAMDYFAYSPFFDTQSNNSVLRTQRRVENPTYGHAEEKVELTAFRSGFEYIVAHSLPPNLFVIHRRTVLPDGGRGPATAAYFILHDKVYQSPNIYDVVSTRLRNTTHLLETTFDSLEQNRPSSNPRAAGVWISKPLEIKETDSRDARAGSTGTGAGGSTPAPGDKDKDKGKEPEKEKETADPSIKEKEQKGPDWHLFHALNMTTAAMDDLDRMAGSAAPEFDSAAEARALDASAAALVRPGPQAASSGQSQAPMPQPPIQMNPGAQSPMAPMSAASPFPGASLGLAGTPGPPGAPSPLRFRMAADSPAP